MPPSRTHRIPPKARGAQGEIGLTAEAREALRAAGVAEHVSVDDDETPVYDPNGANAAWFAGTAASSESTYFGPDDIASPTAIPGEASADLGGSDAPAEPSEIGARIDAQVPVVSAAEKRSRRESREDRALNDPERKPPGSELKTTPPDKDDWLDFFSRIVLRVGLESYVDFAFRGIDESIVSDRDLERVTPTKELRDQIAAPFAVYATKNKWMRKHGREIVSLADSLEAVIQLGIWMRRVNRIASHYRPQRTQRAQPKVTLRPRGNGNGDNGPGQGTSDGTVQGGRNGHVDAGFTIFNPGSG